LAISCSHIYSKGKGIRLGEGKGIILGEGKHIILGEGKFNTNIRTKQANNKTNKQ
jgi:hypothetical protein